MRNLLMVLILLSTSSIFAQVDQRLPNGHWAYYGSEFMVKYPQRTISKDVLFRSLNAAHNIEAGKPDTLSSSCMANCYRHSPVGYDGARTIMFSELFVRRDGQGNFVTEVYCRKIVHYGTVGEVSNLHSELNIEHTWPQSRFGGNFDKNMQKSDMHHLYPVNSMANSRRGNFPFGEVGNSRDELNVQGCSSSQLSRGPGTMVFTPPQEHRGNVARSLFYFATRYNMPLDPIQEGIMRRWHKADPVDQAEIVRNGMIAKHQKTRNPFIDYPELVDQISDF